MICSERQITCTDIAALIHLLSLVIVGASLKGILVTSPMFKLGAGFFLGTYVAFGTAMFQIMAQVFRSYRFAMLRRFGFGKFAMALLLIIAGFFSWLVGWEGNTTVYYGLGVLLGNSLFEFGLRKVVMDDYSSASGVTG